MSGARVAPAAGRNRDPILRLLHQVLPARGTVLEIASGSGEHALWFSTALPNLVWQPTDRDADALASIAAWREGGPGNLRPPLMLDAAGVDWPLSRADAIVAINMVHISPWRATEGLMAGAGRLLPADGVLVLYGPFREGGTPLAAGNLVFDADLRSRDPAWGLREVDDVVAFGAACGLDLGQRVPMPANNLGLVFRRR